MNILYTCFNGKNNSSKILLDNIDIFGKNKLYLKNSFKTSVEQLKNKLKKDEYDLVISFGQSFLEKDCVKIELQGKLEDTYKTNFNYSDIRDKLISSNFHVVISEDAGDYYCNNAYYHGLKYIKEHNLKCKMIFIHIPKIDNITSIKKLSNIFKKV